MRASILNGILIALPWGLAGVAPAAQADIYLHESAEQGILISNLPDENIAYQQSFPDGQAGVMAPQQSGIASAAEPATGALPFNAAVQAAARETMLEPALLHAVIAAESNHNPNAVSPRGAQGLMQLMPATARRFRLSDPYDPVQNVRAGAGYLRELRDLFQGDLALTLAAYNAGPGAVQRHGGRVPPYAETQRYVPKVLELYRRLGKQM